MISSDSTAQNTNIVPPGQVGFCLLPRTDATHNPNQAPEGNLSAVQDSDPTPTMSLCPPMESKALNDDLIFTKVNNVPVEVSLSIVGEREGEYVRSIQGAFLGFLCQQSFCQGASQIVVNRTGSACVGEQKETWNEKTNCLPVPSTVDTPYIPTSIEALEAVTDFSVKLCGLCSNPTMILPMNV